MVLSSMQHIYSKIFSQAASPDYSLLGVGNSEGQVIIFNVGGLTSKGDCSMRDKLQKPETIISAHNGSVYSMTSTSEFCITGASGCLSGWRWDKISGDESEEISKPDWTIVLESDQTNFGTPEINGLAYDNDHDLLFAACGDWRTRSFDMETGKQITCFQGHEDYVHDVVVSDNQVGSCGEDGKVLLWDQRSGKEPRLKLIPDSHEQLSRPHIGKFVTSMDIYNDWMVCGGGPHSGLFHLRSLALTTSLPPQTSVTNVNKFTRHGSNKGGIILAGDAPAVTICNISGDVTSQIKSTSTCVYTVNVTGSESNLLTIGGAGPVLDVCLNLNYKDHSVVVG